MERSKRDKELANTNPQPFPSKEPNPETLETIREGDAFFAPGVKPCFYLLNLG